MALSARNSLSLVGAANARTFVDLDERIVSAQPGVLLVQAPVDIHGPLAAHVARRLRTAGLAPIDAAVRSGAPLFREVATLLGLGSMPCDPVGCAEAIAHALVQRRAAIVASLPAEGTWDRAVVAELVSAPQLVLVFLTDSGSPDWEATTFEVAGDLGPTEKLRWLSGVAEEAHVDLPGDHLCALQAWWAKARRVTPTATPPFDELSTDQQRLLTFLALVGRSVPVAALARTCPDAERLADELARAGLLTTNAGFVSPASDLAAFEGRADDALRVSAGAMLTDPGTFEPDPWAHARAAELYLAAQRFDDADRAIARASRCAADGQAGVEIAARWFSSVLPVTGEGGLTLRLRAAERALLMGEAQAAQRWCESASALAPEDPTIGLLLGRAMMQLGDLVAARVSITKARAAAQDPELEARALSELAEVSYLGGRLDQARADATKAMERAVTAATRLAARSTLGKLELAAGNWDGADAHFAEDALTAAAAGETTAELRARLNRGIASMSKGLLDEARTILERVHDDGRALGQDRACAYALANLGVVAYRQHDYGGALKFWEAAIRYPQALRGRVATAHTIANLADLRLRLGLVEHAEHAIKFGRRLIVGSASPARLAHYKIVAAQVALARRNTELARREIESALVDAAGVGDGEYAGVAWIVAARIALEEGDLARAAHAIASAEEACTTARSRAELAILRALRQRALGECALQGANEALVRARTAGEEDLLAEVHALLATLHGDAGDVQAAQAHCGRSIAVRDQVAAGLPADIRAAFLAKPEIVALSRLQAALAHDSEIEEEAPRLPRPANRGEASAPREIVGDDPQVRGLIVAIRKVARSSSTILIRGESGTGKELVAEALHRASERASGPLVTVNCAALVETLLLSELFGHEKGAFTGATSRRRGRFELAEGGTLFLDEIGDISPRTQVALLRVLQEKTFERVGGAQSIRANVRVICATHRDLKAMVDRGEFREDLYYRLRGITLEVPALRARLGDLPKIADHLLGRIAAERTETKKTLSSDALDLLQRHRWPGNIRELENVLRAVSLFTDGELISAADLIENVDDLRTIAQSGPVSQAPVKLRPSAVPPSPSSFGGAESNDTEEEDSNGALPDVEANATAVAYAQVRQGILSLSDMKRQIERDCIARALAETKGNITRAAALLGMKRPRLSQLVKQYELAASPCEGGGQGQ